MQRIYFIASYPRSGNTWVRAFLYELLRRQGAFPAPDGDLRPLDRYMPSDAAPLFYSRLTGLGAASMTPAIAAGTRGRVHRLLAETATAPLYVKTHAAYGRFSGYPTINIEVARGAVYLVRNPLDVARSLANFLGQDLSEIVRVMLADSAAQPGSDHTIWEPWSSWSINVRSWTGARDFPVLVVRYEDLRADPIATMERIAAHAGIAITPNELAGVAEYLTLERMQAMVDAGTLTLPKRDRTGTFVGSQLERSTAGEDDAALDALKAGTSPVAEQFGYR